MLPNDLYNFFHDVQKELISELESYQLVVNFLYGIDSKIKRKINKKIQNSFLKHNYSLKEKEIQNILLNIEQKYKKIQNKKDKFRIKHS